MKKQNYTGVPLYYIDYFNPKTGKLMDISEEGYATLTLCQVQIESENKQDEEIKQELLAKYEEDMRNFLFDNDTSDREPVYPPIKSLRTNKAPHQYIFDDWGYHEITDHIINDLHLLNASGGQIQTINQILNGTINPETFKSVKNWVSQCFNKPNSDEMKMCAINEVLEGYGIESVRTSKWKNGYWGDILCTYINIGDYYIPTVIHHRKHGFMVASIGDIIEKTKHVI
jgi:hypothetical protein